MEWIQPDSSQKAWVRVCIFFPGCGLVKIGDALRGVCVCAPEVWKGGSAGSNRGGQGDGLHMSFSSLEGNN